MHSFNSCLMHCVFSTKERRPWLTPAVRERLWPYLGGIARENNMKALAIGGVADHAHLLLSLHMRVQASSSDAVATWLWKKDTPRPGQKRASQSDRTTKLGAERRGKVGFWVFGRMDRS